MNLLLNTHIFLWFISGHPKLPTGWRDSIVDPADRVSLSVVSIWEATIKFQLGKLPPLATPGVYLPAQRARHPVTSLLLDEQSVSRLESLPTYHRDPFDRTPVCQALAHDSIIVTVDAAIMQDEVAVLGTAGGFNG